MPVARAFMWPGVLVPACASILPCASKTAADRSPTSRTIGVNDVRMSAAACSFVTAMRRVQRISSVTGSRSGIDLHPEVAVVFTPPPPANADRHRRLPLLDHGRTPDRLPGAEPVAVDDPRLHEALLLVRPDRPPSLHRAATPSDGTDLDRRLWPANPDSPGQDLGLDARRPAPVEAEIGLLEVFRRLRGGPSLQLLAERYGYGLALASVADVGGEVEAHLTGGNARPRQLPSALPRHVVQGLSYGGPVDLAEERGKAAGEVEGRRRRQQAKGGCDPGAGREEEGRDAEHPGHSPGVDRSRAAGGHQREAADVAAALDGVHPRRGGHVLVHDAVDARGGLLLGQGQARRQAPDRLASSLQVERHGAAQEEMRVQVAEEEVRVGYRGLNAALAVAGRPRLGARAVGTHLGQAELVEARDAATTGADLDKV